jgi:hypothetical protein
MRTIRTNRGLLRRWLTLWLEDRRRARAAAHAVPTVPNTPVLTGFDVVTYVQLNWQDLSDNELGFRLYRKENPAAYSLYQTFGPNVTAYQDFGIVALHLYYYYVTAYNAVGESAPSNEISVLAGSS